MTLHSNIAADMDLPTVKAVKRIGHHVETIEKLGIAVRKEDIELLTKLKSDPLSSLVNQKYIKL